jgi:hypothetical protein
MLRSIRIRKYDFLDGLSIQMPTDNSVDAYDVNTATARLIHSGKKVLVDVSLLVDDLRFNLGDWVNVMGYLEKDASGSNWIVKAIMVWRVSPGFNLVDYEETVKPRINKTR